MSATGSAGPLIVGGARILTFDRDWTVHDPGEIRVAGGRVTAVGRAGTLGPPPPGARRIQAQGRVALPGLINAHGHSYGALLKGTVDGLPLDLYMLEVIAAGTDRSPRQVFVSAAIDALGNLRAGNTGFLDHFSHRPRHSADALDAVMSAYEATGIRATVAPMFGDLPYHETVPWTGEKPPAPQVEPPDPAEYFQVFDRAVQAWQGRDGRLRLMLGVDGVQRCSDRLIELAGDYARRTRIGLHTHMLETKTQALMAERRAGGSFVAYLDKHGLIGPASSLVHFVWAGERDIEITAARGCNVVHVPASNLLVGSGIAPIARYRAAGINVGLGADGANCGSAAIFERARLAALLSRVATIERGAWTDARTALRMATRNGAAILGYPGELGEIAPGARADFMLLDGRALDWQPAGDPCNQIVYYETGANVRDVFVGGRQVLADGKVTTVNEADLIGEAAELAEQVARDAAPRLAQVDAVRAPYEAMVDAALAAPYSRQRFAELR